MSLIIISRGEVDGVVRLVQALHRTVTDVVVVDSSKPPDHARLRTELSAIDNLTLRYAVPLGYADPLRPYAYSLAKSDSIFYIDSDEWPSETLLRDLDQILHADREAAGFLIHRFTYYKGRRVNHSLDYVEGRREPTRFEESKRSRVELPSLRRDLQLRLLRRDRIQERGTVHSIPVALGPLKILPPSYYVTEVFSDANRRQKFIKELKLETVMHRSTYGSVIDRSGPEPFRSAVLTYVKAKGFERGSELSRFDYILSHGLERLVRERDLGSLTFQDSYVRAKIETIRALPPALSAILLACSLDVGESGGLIDYLGLRDPATVESLRSYMDRVYDSPEDFTIELVLKKFLSRHPDFSLDITVAAAIDQIRQAAERGVEAIRNLETPSLRPHEDL